jgi:hypothetical protein
MNILEKLDEQINLYAANKKSYSREQLQDIRDEISDCLYRLADPYADTRFNHERAEYLCKLERAKTEESLRGGATKISREQILNKARIETSPFDEEVLNKHREYQSIRRKIEGASNILNSIASRLNRI